MRQLFIEELENVTGGKGPPRPPGSPRCPKYTTLACGEEANGCSGC